MKKFKGVKRLSIIIEQAQACGVCVDDFGFKRGASDHIAFGRKEGQRKDSSPLVNTVANSPGWVLFNAFNGNFLACKDFDVVVNSAHTPPEVEREAWFQQLLEFFYTDDATLIDRKEV